MRGERVRKRAHNRRRPQQHFFFSFHCSTSPPLIRRLANIKKRAAARQEQKKRSHFCALASAQNLEQPVAAAHSFANHNAAAASKRASERANERPTDGGLTHAAAPLAEAAAAMTP